MHNSIHDQNKPVSMLMAMLVKGTIPHALLFAGNDGTGKESVATILSMIFNCKAPSFNQYSIQPTYQDFFNVACKSCISCKKIVSGNHPDIIRICPSGKFIKIAQIRELIETLQIKPVEGQKRVIIMTEAEKMNQEASNALLKSLEEPPESTMFILTTRQHSDMLPTILSRCQHVGFNPVSSEKIAVYIQNQYNISIQDAEILASLSNGSLKKADTLSANEMWINRRRWVIDEFSRLKGCPVKESLLFAEKIAEQKEIVSELLDILLTYVRDLAIFRFSPEKMVNQDLTEIISYHSDSFSVESLLSIADLIQSALKDIHANASLRLTLELMVLKISRV